VNPPSPPGIIHVSFLDQGSPPWASSFVRELDGLFPHPVRLLEAEVDLQPAFSPERNQYHATLILASLVRGIPKGGGRILGITGMDLFIPVLTFVFGQAQLQGPGALLSTFRLRNEHYGLPPDDDLLLDRAMKEAVHELGHTMGLVHCRRQRCVMASSTYVEEVDLKGEWFCPDCVRKVEGSPYPSPPPPRRSGRRQRTGGGGSS
jgi:archaemetzincin